MKPSPRELRVLRTGLRHHSIMYYRGEPEIEDWEYDAMFRLLQKWERQWPEFFIPDSPTQIVEWPDDGSEEHWYLPIDQDPDHEARYAPYRDKKQ